MNNLSYCHSVVIRILRHSKALVLVVFRVFVILSYILIYKYIKENKYYYNRKIYDTMTILWKSLYITVRAVITEKDSHMTGNQLMMAILISFPRYH